jgi:CheY-like chemotaxis protein
VRVFAIKLQGRRHFLATMRDITAEKQTEEALRLANLEMERALRMKDEFLATMSHELRTPLNAVLGISESLAEQVVGPLNEKQARYINVINESGRHLLDLINDILDLAKMEAGKLTLDIGRVNLQTVGETSLRMIRELAQKKQQNVSLALDAGLDFIQADERRLKQMLVNLLSNAVKFTPQGGKLGLEMRGALDKTQVIFTVWDTGIGIEAGDLPHLFQPFVQLDAGLTREQLGTGLGLTLVAQMARLHGGSVNVESQPGKGSRFTILLPWIKTESTADQPGEQNNTTVSPNPVVVRQAGPHTILLVEDTEAVSMLVQDYLETAGYRVAVAKDGWEGISQAKRLRPDLILMDIQMPLLNGLDATRKIRAEAGLEHVPIIALTALAMPGDRERCLAAGMNEYLSKPIRLNTLVEMIQRFLDPGQGERV